MDGNDQARRETRGKAMDCFKYSERREASMSEGRRSVVITKTILFLSFLQLSNERKAGGILRFALLFVTSRSAVHSETIFHP